MLNPGILALMIPIIALIIPIVVILTAHQRKMAEIIHQSHATQPGELDGIRSELQQLRMLMNQHAIALDDVRSKQSFQAPPLNVQDRLGAS